MEQKNNIVKGLDDRKYQLEAWESMANFTRQWLKGNLENPKNIDWWTTMPVHMATGSGKTATVGVHMRKIFTIRDRMEGILHKEIPLRVLVLNDRINLINQIRSDFVEGRGEKGALFGEDIQEHAEIKTYHSKADSIEDIVVEDGVDILGKGKDAIYFSTFGSANKFADEEGGWHIIIVDEAHHLSAPTYKEILNDQIAKSIQQYGKPPLIIPMSATIDTIRHLINDPVVNFGLPEYILSKDSPDISYNLITNTDFTGEDLEYVKGWIDDVSKIENFKEKKEKIMEIRQYIEDHLAIFTDLGELCDDLLHRLPSIDHTIVFAHSIEEVNQITTELNSQYGEGIAIALHSKIDEASPEVLEQYNSGKKKIIVAVDMLNEGIDMPQTNNVVFWRNTKSPTVFQQQFGRGLRGKNVAFYDYTGVFANMSYINGINNAIEELYDERELEEEGRDEGGEKRPRKGIGILFGDIKGNRADQQHEVNLKDILQQVEELEYEVLVELSVEEIKDYLDGLGGYEKLMKYNRAKIAGLELKGVKIYSLSTRYGFKSQYRLSVLNPTGFQEFVSHVYGKDFEYEKRELTVENIKAYLDGLGGYEKLMKYNHAKIAGLELKGLKIASLAKRYGFTTQYGLNIVIPTGFQEFVSHVYGKDFEYEKGELTVENIKAYLDGLGGYEKLMKYNHAKIAGLELKGVKIKSLATRYGFTSQYGLTVQTPTGFQEFVSYVYGEKFEYEIKEKGELTVENIKEYLDGLGGYEKLMKYNHAKIAGLELKGVKITGLATRYGFESQYGLNVAKSTGFQEFVSHVYGKDFEYEKGKLTQEEIKEYLDGLGGYEKLMKYNHAKTAGLELKGVKIRSLAARYGFTSQYGLTVKTPIGFQEFVSHVYGKDFEYEKGELTVENIKAYLDGLGGYEKLMKYSYKEIEGLELKGVKIAGLAARCGFGSQFSLHITTITGFQEFVSYVYGEKFEYEIKEKVELTKEEIKEYLDGLGGYKKLMKYSQKEIAGLELKGVKITALATRYGFTSQYGLRIQLPIGFQEFVSHVYREPFVYTK